MKKSAFLSFLIVQNVLQKYYDTKVFVWGKKNIKNNCDQFDKINK